MQKISNKKILEFIKRESKKLPEEFYRTFTKPVFKDGKIGRYLINDNNKVNHARRMYRIWKRTKNLVIVFKYFRSKGFELNFA